MEVVEISREERDVYLIPQNFVDTGTILGGTVKLRNALEAAVLAVGSAIPLFYLPLAFNIRLMIVIAVSVPLGVFGVVGIGGDSLTQFVAHWLRFIKRRRIVTPTPQGNLEANRHRHLRLISKRYRVIYYDDADVLPHNAQVLQRKADRHGKLVKRQTLYDLLPIEKIENGILHTTDDRYIKILEIDSTAAPVCIIAPISSWAGAVGSSLRATGSFASDFAAFCATIPYNLYALLTLLMIVFLIFTGWDFGPMRRQEEMAAADTVPDNAARQAESPCKNGTVADMVLPIVLLIVLAMLGMLYNGGFWAVGEPGYHSLTGALNNCTAAQALCWGGFGAVLFAFLLYVPRGLITFKEFMACVTEGFKNMIPANLILVLAWTISGLCRDQLLTAEFVRDAMTHSQIPGALLPAIIFVVAAFLSFSIGSSWGTFGILIPIIVPVATALSPNLLIVSLSATLGGSIFGDHCSPISDTTILSSTGAGCDHLTHVATQMPYALLVAGCCLFGYLVAGFSDGNLLLMFGSSLAALIGLITIMHFSYQKHAVSLPKEI